MLAKATMTPATMAGTCGWGVPASLEDSWPTGLLEALGRELSDVVRCSASQDETGDAVVFSAADLGVL
jgi:hypothetical protein